MKAKPRYRITIVPDGKRGAHQFAITYWGLHIMSPKAIIDAGNTFSVHCIGYRTN